MPLAQQVFDTTATFCSSMFSSSSSSSSATTICNSTVQPILLLLIMVLLSSVAAAFRSSVAVASTTTASPRRSATAATTSTRTTDRGDEDDGDERRERLLPSASGSSTSFAADVVQAATEVIERNHRRYWAETAPPFGIRDGLRKLRRKRKKQRQVRAKHGQRRSTEQMGCENDTMVETSVRSRSVMKGSLLNGADEGHDASSGDHGDASSISSEYTWEEEEDIGQDDVDPFIATDQTMTHLCFLVHGHRGQSKDLSYMAAAIQGRSSEVRKQRLKELQRLESARNDGDGEKRDDAAAAIDEIRSSLGQRVVVHSVTCNEGKTHDGVRAGGERCVEEMLQVIRKEADRTRRKRQAIRKHNGNGSANDDELDEAVRLHVSLVGNSLGGIYSRYAVAQLFDRSENKHEHDGEPCFDNNAILLDNGSIRLHFQTFCTTATPHLGCSKHTYVSLPRSAETVVGNILGETGRDLFRMNDLLYNMSTDPYFLRPLSVFQRRVAYANGYHTDFPVPTSTAAFLHEESSHAHFWEDTAAMGIGDSELDKSIVAILRTEASYSTSLSSSKDFKDEFFDECDDELHVMSKALDSLGWKKIIVDLRPEIPAISLPGVVQKSSIVIKSKMKKGAYGAGGIVSEDLGEEEEDLLHNNGTLADSQVLRASLRRKESIASRDAKEAFGSVRDGSIHFPVGHNMICAFSRGRVSSHMNRGGRPVMDALAKEIVDGMLGPEIGG